MCSVQKKDCRPLALEVVSQLVDVISKFDGEGAFGHPKERSVRGEHLSSLANLRTKLNPYRK